MKRLNPKTGVPFKMGDIRNDGRIFKNYVLSIILKDGYFKENWLTLLSFQNYKKQQKQSDKQKQPQRSKKHQNKLMSTKVGCIKRRFFEVRSRAKKAMLSFDLTEEYLTAIAPDKCPVLGFDLVWWNQTGKILPESASLDKINPNKGYVIGNVQWLSNQANTMKNRATPKQLHQFADWVKSTIPNE